MQCIEFLDLVVDSVVAKVRVLSESEFLERALILSEALPYMQNFAGRYCVIKYGGAAMRDKSLAKSFANDIVMLKQVGVKPVVVHGGGPDINRMLDLFGLETKFVDGFRVTDHKIIEIVESVLCGSVNKRIVQEINKAGGRAVGICGKDDSLIEAHQKQVAFGKQDLGYVGTPIRMKRQLIDDMYEQGIIPVIAPICSGVDCDTYNVNSDVVAGFIARELDAEKLLMLTDVQGIIDSDGQLIQQLTVKHAEKMLNNGIISGGMIPKVETCIDMVKNSNGAAHVLDGRLLHVILLELFTVHGCGTMIVK